ncbi:MAG TPA: tripartite tricarboxylate transporter substrate binding protein [Noviherbaspirillum sp.]|uniref:Bug family tripartite tricarboxylate transporter substrate binding protein n=1 Tax=Noviherbaspirillum sp. TaxID=1926288 RepID=UPI002F94B896
MNRRTLLTAGLLSLGLATSAFAQQFPSQRVTIIVPYAPGGGVDIMIRAVAVELTAKWGQPVVVENKPGAGTLIGADAVARATPDGHTLLATVDQTFVANRFLYKKLPYDPDKSFAPVTLMAESDHFVLAKNSLPANNLRELVDLAKREKGKLNYGSYGGGSQPQLVFSMLNERAGTDILHIPYKGVAPMLTAIVAGEVDLGTGSAGVAGEMLRTKQMKALAIAGQKRSPQFPDVPTTAEMGYPYLQAGVWYGVFAPANTPANIVNKINADITAILKQPSFVEKQGTSRGLSIVANAPKEFAERIRKDTAQTAEMVRAAKIEAE